MQHHELKFRSASISFTPGTTSHQQAAALHLHKMAIFRQAA
ncbi:MAG: hypothetical protein Q4D19_11755 [Lautropia sp.]|nr:hypothetical protein [Lautropia sp.]